MATGVARIEVLASGFIQIRMTKPDGGHHRTTIEPGGDATLRELNHHLDTMGDGAVPSGDMAQIDLAARAIDPALIAAYKRRRVA